MEQHEFRHLATPQPAGAAGSGRWIQSPRYDAAFFILSPLVALPMLLFAPAGNSLIVLTFAMLLGIPHYLSSFVFFFWDENRELHRAHWLVFFGGPILIVVFMVMAVTFRVPFIIQVIVYFWNTYHVGRQSCGLLSIYRHRAGVRDNALRTIANNAILWTAFALAFWNIEWYGTLHRFLQLFSPALPDVVRWVTVTGAVLSLARLAWSLWTRRDGPMRPALPELGFLATSLLLFHPYLWVQDPNRATLGMLLGHFIQYLGIVWLVHYRKFNSPGTTVTPYSQWLASLSRNVPMLIGTLMVVGFVFMAGYLLAQRNIATQAAYEAMYLSLSLVHFYLDGLFWAFRRPEVRATLGPLLMPAR